jgi:hypothetical protein
MRSHKITSIISCITNKEKCFEGFFEPEQLYKLAEKFKFKGKYLIKHSVLPIKKQNSRQTIEVDRFILEF